jgi:hypothetical protein
MSIFDKLESCVLCSHSAKIMGSEVGEVCFYHLDCPFCGEYFISTTTLDLFEMNPEYQKKKRVLSGMAFEAHFYHNKPLRITPELIE